MVLTEAPLVILAQAHIPSEYRGRALSAVMVPCARCTAVAFSRTFNDPQLGLKVLVSAGWQLIDEVGWTCVDCQTIDFGEIRAKKSS